MVKSNIAVWGHIIKYYNPLYREGTYYQTITHNSELNDEDKYCKIINQSLTIILCLRIIIIRIT